MKKIQLISASVLLLTLMLVLNGVAHALPCDYGFVNGDQSGDSYLCLDGTGSNANVEELNSGDGFFNVNTWVLLQKVETPGMDEIGAFNLGLEVDPESGEATEGTWKFNNSPWDLYTNIMIVLKASNVFTAYEVTSGDISGNWEIGQDKPALSNMSVYGSGALIPEPGTLMLLGSGLFGFAAFRKKIKV